MQARSLSTLPNHCPDVTLETSLCRELAALRVDMAVWREELRAEIRIAESSVTRQMHIALLFQTWVLLGFLCFFATYAN
jgi:hypothetical protein